MLLRVGVRFYGSNLLKRAIDVYPVIESGQFLATRMMAICSIYRIIVPLREQYMLKVWALLLYYF